MSLRPPQTTQKALISTTSRLVGEYEDLGILFALAFPDFHNNMVEGRMSEGPISRNAIIVAFETPAIEQAFGPVPDYSPSAHLLCCYMSVLYGKRFDSHGLIEGMGIFHVPDLTPFSQLNNHHLPSNSHSTRIDYPVPLSLGEISRISPLILGPSLDQKFLQTFGGASKFYLQALQLCEADPEVAYLSLITAGEILSNYHDYDAQDLLDDQIKVALEKIRQGLPDGQAVVKLVSSRLLQIKSRFVKTILSLIDQDFFTRSESRDDYVSFKADTFPQSVAAAYDLRSKYVHTGVSFGRWIAPNSRGMNAEKLLGKPIIEDVELSKILHKAPTFIGLERVLRCCLLTFAKKHGAYVEPPKSTDFSSTVTQSETP